MEFYDQRNYVKKKLTNPGKTNICRWTWTVKIS